MTGPGPGLRSTLSSWVPPDDVDGAQGRLRDRYLAHLGPDPAGWSRSSSPVHPTASSFVVDPTGTRTLLVLHRRGGFWVQPGGHLEEGDEGPRAAALREVVEETGLGPAHLSLSPAPVDLDAHLLGEGFGHCREHLDLTYLAVADPGSPMAVSAESDGLAWWSVSELDRPRAGAPVVPDLPDRLRRALRRHGPQLPSGSSRSQASA